MKRLASVLCILLLGAFALSAEITGEVNVKPQHNVKLSVTGIAPKGSAVWSVKPMDGQDPKEVEWVSARKGPCICWIGPTGRYSVTVTLAALDKDGNLDLDMTDTVVTIGQPGPVPPPPGPTDPTQAAVIAAYATETDAAKATQVAALAALYRQMALKLNDPITVTTLATVGQLQKVFDAAKVTMGITPTMLPKTRRVIADYVNSQTGTVATAPLDRAKAAVAFQKVADCLATVKGRK